MNKGRQSYPKKMNAFWKNTAIPGYTTGFSNKRKKSPSAFWKSFARISQSVLYLTLNNVASKKDPHGSNQGPKSHHKTDEQPDPSTWKKTSGWLVPEDRRLWCSAWFCFTAPSITHQSCTQIHHVYAGMVLTALLRLYIFTYRSLHNSPGPRTCLSQAAFAVTVTPHLPVGHCVDPAPAKQDKTEWVEGKREELLRNLYQKDHDVLLDFSF